MGSVYVVVFIKQNLDFPIQMLVKNSLNSYHLGHFQEMVPLVHSSVLLSKGFFELKSLSHNLKNWTDKNQGEYNIIIW